MDDIQVVKRLLEVKKLDQTIRAAERLILEERKGNLEEPEKFYCFTLDERCKCGHMFPEHARINAELVSDSGKYMRIECPECGIVKECKRTSWWPDSKVGESLIERVDYGGFDRIYMKVEKFVDLTKYYKG